MESDLQLNSEASTPGQRLANILDGYREFMENVFRLACFLETEMDRRGYALVRPGGYYATRSGLGSGLTNFAGNDWVTNHVGVAFTRKDRTSFAGGVSTTTIQEGLDLILFQVRFLDRSPEEPVIWRVALHVTPGEGTPEKWEKYQTLAYKKLQAPSSSSNESVFDIQPASVRISGTSVDIKGHVQAVPVMDISDSEDVIRLLLNDPLSPIA